MNLPKNVTVNSELGFYYPVIDKANRILIGRWIGAVEVVVDGYQDEDGWQYVTELYLAYQLISGRVVYVEECDPTVPMHVRSLKGKLYDIRWGYYPVGFNKEWQYCTAAPATNPPGITAVEAEQLPF